MGTISGSENLDTTFFITPSKQKPLFIALNTYFGYMDRNLYKKMCVGSSIRDTWALSYAEAISDLHTWIQENKEYILSMPKNEFQILEVTGQMNEYNEWIETKVYSISQSKIRKYFN